MHSLDQQLIARLTDLAARAETTTYGALARDLGARMAEVTAALESLMDADAALGQPFRAALLDARLTPGQPARGFFEKAALLGRPLAPKDIAAERAALFAAAARDTSAT